MNYTLYDPSTGQIIANIIGSDPAENSSYVEGIYDGKIYYIDNGQPVAIPQKPIAFLQSYIFDWTTKMWTTDMDATTALVKRYRNNLLNQSVDLISPIWWASLTAEQQAEATTYRQALLDVPSQTGFPTNVVWPTKPSWL